MDTNPIKKLHGLLDKLIIEHGSAVVQEKHIALLKEQLSLVEKENAELKAQKQSLEEENQALKNNNIYLKKKIDIYEKPSHVITIDEIELKILIYLATQEHDKISPEDISKSVDIKLQMAIFHLNNLKNKQMVDSRPIAPFDHSPKRFWTLSQNGRHYLIENSHIF